MVERRYAGRRLITSVRGTVVRFDVDVGNDLQIYQTFKRSRFSPK